MGYTRHEFIKYLRDERQLSKLTADAYLSDIWSFERIFPGVAPSDVTRHNVLEWVSRLGQKSLSASSITRAIHALRCWLRWAGNTCADDIELPRLSSLLPDPIDQETVLEVLEHMRACYQASVAKSTCDGVSVDTIRGRRTCWFRADYQAGRNWCLMEFLYGTGCRVSEALTLREDGLDLRSGTARVIGKGNRERIVVLGDRCVEAFSEWFARCRSVVPDCAPRGSALVFGGITRGITRGTAHKIVKDAGEAAGVRDLHPHRFRHSFASHMLAGGADSRVIRELLGHRRLSTTQRYAAVDLRQKRSAVENLVF